MTGEALALVDLRSKTVTVGLESICLTLSAADVPRRAKFAAIGAELDPSIHTPFVGDRERLALAAVGGLWSAVGPPMRPVALLSGDGGGESAADAIALAPGHCTIVSCGKSRLGGGSREGSEATSRTRLTRKPAAFGVPMAYFRRRVIGVEPAVRGIEVIRGRRGQPSDGRRALGRPEPNSRN
jgi:hypothetical protein